MDRESITASRIPANMGLATAPWMDQYARAPRDMWVNIAASRWTTVPVTHVRIWPHVLMETQGISASALKDSRTLCVEPGLTSVQISLV